MHFLLFSIQGTPLSIFFIRLYDSCTRCTSLGFRVSIPIHFIFGGFSMSCVLIRRLELVLLLLWLALDVVVLLVGDRYRFCFLTLWKVEY